MSKDNTGTNYIQRLRQRYLFAAKTMQDAALNNGTTNTVNLEGPGKRFASYTDTYYDIRMGEQKTTVDEQQSYIANVTPHVAQSSPDPPTNLVATPSPTSISVAFTNPASDGGSAITNYLYSTDDGSTFTAFSPPDTASPVTITGLSPNTSYSIKLKAVNTVGSSSASATVTTTTLSGVVPGAPTLQLALADDTSAWIYVVSASGGNETNYEYSLDGTTFTPLSPADATNPVQITGLTNGTTYSITLQAINIFGSGLPSNTLTVTPTATSPTTEWLYYDPSNSASYPGSGTTVSNLGSYGTLNGTMTGVVYNPADKGGIFNFDGSDWISFSGINFGTAITVTAWIFPRTTSTINGLIGNAPSNQSPSGFKLGWNNWLRNSRALYFEAGNGTIGSGSARNSVENIITYDAWQHVAYVFDQANRTIIFFLNGVPVTIGSADITTEVNIGMNNPTFRIGSFTDSGYRMNAKLGYIKVYNSKLNAAQIYSDYTASQARFA